MLQFPCLAARLSLALVVPILIPAASAADLPASVSLANLNQTYDGSPKRPAVITDPPGLAVSWQFTSSGAVDPEPMTEKTVYCNMPSSLELSYPSHSFASQSTFGLGNQLQLADTARELTSVDVILVTWAKAATYPLWSLLNHDGWSHPVTITVFDMDSSNVLNKIGEFTQQIFVPWRPLLLPNGQPYYYNGYAFTAHFNVPAGLVLPAKPMFMVSYNTQSSGFAPLGLPGPYNELNVANGGGPTIGTDVTPTSALWVRSATNWVYPARNANPPMFTVKARELSGPHAADPPVNAGTWQATATITEPGYQGEATASFTIQPAAAQVLLGDLNQVADGGGKSATVATVPPNLPVLITYDNSEALPSQLGRYLVRASIIDPNYSGAAEGEFWLGQNLSSWLDPWIRSEALSPSESGSQDDPDHDSISNLLEYAFALDPTSASSLLADGGLPKVSFSDRQLALTYRKNLAATDLEYIVEASDRLGANERWAAVVTEDSILDADGTTETIRATIPVSGSEVRKFLRLSVVRH